MAGTIKLTAPEDMGTHLIAPLIAQLGAEYPQLHFELEFTNDVIDLVGEGFDLAVRIGPLRESRLKSRKLGQLSLILVAAPTYLSAAKKITHPRDLSDHACLPISSSELNRVWRLKKGKQNFSATIAAKMECNQMTTALTLALSGAGIALVPRYLCEEALAQKRLLPVLPDWSEAGMPVSLMLTVPSTSSARLKVVADRLSAMLSQRIT